MEYLELKEALNALNKGWNFEHVVVMGGKCNSFTEEVMANYLVCQNEETYILVNWCERGFDYSGKFEEHNIFFIRGILPIGLTVEEVYEDLGQALEGVYEVETVKNSNLFIKLVGLRGEK